MVIGHFADSISRSLGNVTDTLAQPFTEPVIRLGVTGLSRAGKTVFITSLVANLLDRARMPQLVAEAENRILAAHLQPQPDDTMPRFDYEQHLGALTSATPFWPEGTRAVSQLRLSLKLRPTGLLAGVSGARKIHLDIVDYPGEWLLDLGLMDKTYDQWAADTLSRLAKRPGGEAYLAMARSEDGSAPFEEPRAKALAASFTE